jgi:hypothetical protein
LWFTPITKISPTPISIPRESCIGDSFSKSLALNYDTSRANATSLQMLSVILTWHHAIVKNSMLSLVNTMQQARKTTLPTFQSVTCLLESEQQKDWEVKKLLQDHPNDYKTVSWKHGNHKYQLMVNKDGCIYVPKQLQSVPVHGIMKCSCIPARPRLSSLLPIIIHGRACARLSSMSACNAMHASIAKGNIPSWENSTPRIQGDPMGNSMH